MGVPQPGEQVRYPDQVRTGRYPSQSERKRHTTRHIASAHSAVLSWGGGGGGRVGTPVHDWDWLGLGYSPRPGPGTPHLGLGPGVPPSMTGTGVSPIWDWATRPPPPPPPPPARTGVPPWERIWGTSPPYGGEQTENITFLILRMRVVIISLQNWKTLLIFYSVLFV